jgi:hypothetical protein
MRLVNDDSQSLPSDVSLWSEFVDNQFLTNDDGAVVDNNHGHPPSVVDNMDKICTNVECDFENNVCAYEVGRGVYRNLFG